MKKLKLDHVERLSRGKRSGLNIGSRSVGHHLKAHERDAYVRALKKGYLDITEKDRANLWHIWEKACVAQQKIFLVLIKDSERGLGRIYSNNTDIGQLNLPEAKEKIKRLASAKLKA